MFKRSLSFTDAFKIASAIALVGLIMALFFVAKDIFITFFVAVIFAIALDKPIDFLVRKKIPRAVATVFIYLFILLLLGFLLYNFLPLLAQELKSLAIGLPFYLERFFSFNNVIFFSDSEPMELSQHLRTLADAFGASSQTIVGTIFAIFGSFFTFLIIFFVALFFNIQKDGVRHFLFFLVPRKNLTYAYEFFDKIQNRVTGWIWGKSVSSLLVGIIIYIGLTIIGVPYALALSVLTAFLNFIPFIGPIIASLPAILFALAISLPAAIATAILYFVSNSIIESFVFMPFFMNRSVNVNPAFLIFFVLLGGRLAGVPGVIISIPVAAIFSLVFEEFVMNKNKDFKKIEN